MGKPCIINVVYNTTELLLTQPMTRFDKTWVSMKVLLLFICCPPWPLWMVY
jgi:hypothetical protein